MSKDLTLVFCSMKQAGFKDMLGANYASARICRSIHENRLRLCRKQETIDNRQTLITDFLHNYRH
ncbi:MULTISPECIES: hypothetical protein [unclassified Methanosarcina]|uniref:hypothetical protein n=1 Tax=unclassified Methanosarcina TaxID=2644672 RepID=UPI0025E4CAF6|nr:MULTISPECIES: hypothetical protein [unclassified Methanosarcina]